MTEKMLWCRLRGIKFRRNCTDAVQTAVMSLENCPLFNAGSVLFTLIKSTKWMLLLWMENHWKQVRCPEFATLKIPELAWAISGSDRARVFVWGWSRTVCKESFGLLNGSIFLWSVSLWSANGTQLTDKTIRILIVPVGAVAGYPRRYCCHINGRKWRKTGMVVGEQSGLFRKLMSHVLSLLVTRVFIAVDCIWFLSYRIQRIIVKRGLSVQLLDKLVKQLVKVESLP